MDESSFPAGLYFEQWQTCGQVCDWRLWISKRLCAGSGDPICLLCLGRPLVRGIRRTLPHYRRRCTQERIRGPKVRERLGRRQGSCKPRGSTRPRSRPAKSIPARRPATYLPRPRILRHSWVPATYVLYCVFGGVTRACSPRIGARRCSARRRERIY